MKYNPVKFDEWTVYLGSHCDFSIYAELHVAVHSNIRFTEDIMFFVHQINNGMKIPRMEFKSRLKRTKEEIKRYEIEMARIFSTKEGIRSLARGFARGMTSNR